MWALVGSCRGGRCGWRLVAVASLFGMRIRRVQVTMYFVMSVAVRLMSVSRVRRSRPGTPAHSTPACVEHSGFGMSLMSRSDQCSSTRRRPQFLWSRSGDSHLLIKLTALQFHP